MITVKTTTTNGSVVVEVSNPSVKLGFEHEDEYYVRMRTPYGDMVIFVQAESWGEAVEKSVTYFQRCHKGEPRVVVATDLIRPSNCIT